MLRQKRTSPVGLRRLMARVSELERPNGSRDMEATKAASPVKSVSPRLRTRNSGFSQRYQLEKARRFLPHRRLGTNASSGLPKQLPAGPVGAA